MDVAKYGGTLGTNFFPNFPLPRNAATSDWSPGGEFTWPITAFWRIGINLDVLPWSDQHFKLDSSGTMTITKFGISVTRDINNNRTPSLP